MIIDKETYESNRIARRKHPCINPRCSNFVEIQNSYNICIRCFDMLVDHLGSEHMIFDYNSTPILRCMTMTQLKSILRRAEIKAPKCNSVKRGNSNSQRKWVHVEEEMYEDENY